MESQPQYQPWFVVVVAAIMRTEGATDEQMADAWTRMGNWKIPTNPVDVVKDVRRALRPPGDTPSS